MDEQIRRHTTQNKEEVVVPPIRSGGEWRPVRCQPREKVAIIVPYRCVARADLHPPPTTHTPHMHTHTHTTHSHTYHHTHTCTYTDQTHRHIHTTPIYRSTQAEKYYNL